jgi:hypothetical protein
MNDDAADLSLSTLASPTARIPPPDARRMLEALDERDIAALCDVDLETVRRWRTRSMGPPWVCLGGAALYPTSLFRQWMIDHATRPTNPPAMAVASRQATAARHAGLAARRAARTAAESEDAA